MMGKYILRIYDSELDNQLCEAYQKQKDQFPSMNAYLTELIRTGLNGPVLHREDSSEQLLETAINTLIVGFEKQEKDNEVITRLLSSIYALTLAKNEEGYLSRQKVEEGFYDDLPKRFEDK